MYQDIVNCEEFVWGVVYQDIVNCEEFVWGCSVSGYSELRGVCMGVIRI